jgi:hypothetical protein
VIRFGRQLKSQKWAAFTLCHHQFRYQPYPAGLTGNTKSIAVLKVFCLDNSTPESGEKRFFPSAQFCGR